MRSLRASTVAILALVLLGASTIPVGAFIRGKHRPVPIVLEKSQLKGGPCHAGAQSRSTCSFWYANGSAAVGDTDWSFVDLDSWGIRKRGACPAPPGAADRGEYILHRYPEKLGFDTVPTYACSSTGLVSSNAQDLADIVGQHRLFPVNDCSRQVDAGGSVVPCGAGTPDKFAIVGYRRFILVSVVKWNDPAAMGTPGTPGGSGTCTGSELGLDAAGTRNLDELAVDLCLAVDPVDSIAFDAASSTDAGAAVSTSFKAYNVTSTAGGPVTTYYPGCLAGGTTDGCDYTYDPDTFTLQWVNPTSLANGATKLIDLQWIRDATPGTPGICGIRPADPNSLCLTLWVP